MNFFSAHSLRRWLGALAIGLICVCPALTAREVIPPTPARYFNDYVGVVPSAAQAQLNAQLEQFERDTSNQIVVAIYPRMESDSSLEDYATRVYQAWRIGQKGKNNGALLLVFTQSHRMRIATGYGLEGALPDALCARIMRDDIAPHLRAGDWAGGMRAGVNAMIAAARGEYKGSGRTVAEAAPGNAGSGLGALGIFVIVVVLIILVGIRQRRRSFVYGPRGRGIIDPFNVPWWLIAASSRRNNDRGSSDWGSWGGGGGGFGGGGGGGFSGGGGSTGGGGASGSW